jgi:hypothetical protein
MNKNIDQDRILNYLNQNKVKEDICDHSDFIEWNEETDEIKTVVEKIGKITLPSNSSKNKNCWRKDSKIELDKYPYLECEIHQCQKCKSIFFHHIELTGNAPQRRYRLLRKELIDLDSIKPKVRIIIDSEPFKYQVYKNPDLSYEISICKPVALGIDIYHKLTKQEEVEYLKNGIKALQNRIEDMDGNYNKYKVVSWR